MLGDTLYKVFSANLNLEFSPIKELFELSDHAGLKITLADIEDKSWFKRAKIPNSKIGGIIEDKIRTSGFTLADLREEFFKYPRKLVKKIKLRYKPRDEVRAKEILDDLCDKVEVSELKQKEKKGFAEFKKNIAKTIFSKDSKQGWNGLKALSKFHLVDKKEGKLVDAVLLEDGNLIRGKEKDKIILKEFMQMHSETNFKILEGAKFEYDILLSDNDVRRTLNELSFNKACGWDAINDTTFRLCPTCRVDDTEFCNTCKNIVKCTRQIFTKKFWEDPSSGIHLVARLVALDKSKDGKPGPSQFRPIVIGSVVSKILEAYFMHQLSSYCRNKLNKNQVGGVKYRSILDNVLR